MPELPEVETVKRGLSRAMTGQKIARVDARRHNLRIPFPKNLKDIEGATVTDIERRAKYLLLRLSNGLTMLAHLGMSGRMTVHPKNSAIKPGLHDHLIISLANGTDIFFNDARRFGLIDLSPTKDVEQHRFFKHLGPEPLERGFTAAKLAEKIKGKKPSIKVTIMDQAIVVGVGNIYASEALFQSRIDPRRAAGSLKAAEIDRLVPAIKDVLKKAIAQGGSSLRDYKQADGELGYFQHHWAVYGKAGEPCPNCKKPIEKITQGGRSTFFCPKCQK